MNEEKINLLNVYSILLYTFSMFLNRIIYIVVINYISTKPYYNLSTDQQLLNAIAALRYETNLPKR